MLGRYFPRPPPGIHGKNVSGTQMLDVSLFGVGTVLGLKRDARSMVK